MPLRLAINTAKGKFFAADCVHDELVADVVARAARCEEDKELAACLASCVLYHQVLLPLLDFGTPLHAMNNCVNPGQYYRAAQCMNVAHTAACGAI